MSSLFEYDNGKAKMTFKVFGIFLSIFILSWFITFGIGGPIGIAIGVCLSLIFGILTVVFGLLSVITYMTWLEDK